MTDAPDAPTPPHPDGPIDLFIAPRRRSLGAFSVARVLPYAKRRMVGPFIFWDEMGPADFGPGEGIDVRPHPHIGLSTVTYLFDGALFHRDSLGVAQAIEPGALNLMTAGSGIVHSERPDPRFADTPHRLHGIQAWLALPKDKEDQDPAFVHVAQTDLPLLEAHGVRVRVIFGTGLGASSPVALPSPTLYLHLEMGGGSHFDLGAEEEERAVYVVDGPIAIGTETIQSGTMAVLKAGQPVTLTAAEPALVMVLGGAPLPERRFIDWNFVASEKEKIAWAKDQWRAAIAGGFQDTHFKMPETESEWIPLPEDQAAESDGPPEPCEDCPTT